MTPYLFAEQITPSFVITNTPGSFCKQFSFFCSIDIKQISRRQERLHLTNETSVNNKLSTVATRVIHEV